MISDKDRILELESRIVKLELIIENLLKENADLKLKKTSRNSSVSPSKDENRPIKNQSLRVKSGKKPGGQKGHQGTTLKMTEDPDKIIEYNPDFCNCCGKDLASIQQEFLQKRQVVDLPVVHPEYTEHRIYKKVCSCGQENSSVFPENVKASISYGANIQASIAYMFTRQYLPFERMSEYFRDFYNVSISQGTIYNILTKFAAKSQPAYELIAQKMESDKTVGTDETGIKVNTKKGWFWTWQSKLATYVVFSKNRGIATIDANFQTGFKDAVLVHDCWSSHFKTKCKTHQLCVAHLIRELVYLEERFENYSIGKGKITESRIKEIRDLITKSTAPNSSALFSSSSEPKLVKTTTGISLVPGSAFNS